MLETKSFFGSISFILDYFSLIKKKDEQIRQSSKCIRHCVQAQGAPDSRVTETELKQPLDIFQINITEI